LQKAVDEQRRTVSKGVEEDVLPSFIHPSSGREWKGVEEDVGQVAHERCAITSSPCEGNLLLAAGASIAEWRQWAMRCDTIEERLDEHVKSFQAMRIEKGQVDARLNKHDMVIQAHAQAISTVHEKVTATHHKEDFSVQSLRLRMSESLRVTGEQYSDLVKQVSAHDAKLETTIDDLKGLKTHLSDTESEQQSFRSALVMQIERVEAVNSQVRESTAELQAFSQELHVKLESKADSTLVKKMSRQLREILTASESSLDKREGELASLAAALENRDSRVEVLAAELRRTQAEVTEEIHQRRDLLRQFVADARTNRSDLSVFTDLTNIQAYLPGDSPNNSPCAI